MPRILFITPNAPYPPSSGASQRSDLILRALREIGDTDLFLLAWPQRLDAEQLALLKRDHALVACRGMRIRAEHGIWRFLRPFGPGLIDAAAKYLGGCEPGYTPQPHLVAELERCLAERGYDAIVTRYLRGATRSGALEYTPVIVDVDDLDSQVCRSELNVPAQSRLRRGFVERRLRRLAPVEQDWLALADHVWVSNADDLRQPGLERGVWLPNIPFEATNSRPSPPPPPPSQDCATVLSIGALHYAPHIAGLEWFVRNVWVKVVRQFPAARLEIVGPGLTNRQRRRWSGIHGVCPIGFVDDLRETYERCALTINPVFVGGGTHIKVLESLYYGRVPLVTPHGLRGYEQTLKHGESVYVADGAEALADGCVRLLRERDFRCELAERGGRLVRSEFSYERIRRVVDETLRAALQGGGLRPR